VLRFTSEHLPKLGVVDDVIEEPLGGAHRDHHQMASRLKSYLSKTIDQLSKLPVDELIENRYSKFRKMGSYLERLEDGTMQPFGYSFVT
jgi:acetyl-CoA carboxylase carboxyl transferase subunit alpha